MNIDDDLMDLLVPVVGVAFAILFIAFIFIKSFIDNKKDKEILTEIFRKYGVKTNAKIYDFVEHYYYGGYIPGKYNFRIEFQYNSTKCGAGSCYYVLPTNNPKSKEYLKSEEIPIIYIPAHIDYYKGLISRKEFFSYIGHKLNLGDDCWLVIFAEDINSFTNLSEL